MTTPSSEPRDPPSIDRPVDTSGPFAIPLAMLAIVTGLLDVLLSRGLLRLIGNFAHRDFALTLETACRFVRNLSAVSVLVGLLVVTQRAMRSPHFDFGVGRRILIGTLAGVLFPVLVIALVLPDPHTTIILLLIGIASGYLMAFVFAWSAFDDDAPIDQRVACTFAMLLAFASLGTFVAETWSRLPTVDANSIPTRSLRNLTEVTYFALPVSLAVSEIARHRAGLTRLAIVPGGLAAAITFVSVLALEHALPADFDLLLYGALRLDSLDGAPVVAYATLLALSAFGIVVALLDPARRRLGIGVALVFLAGAGGGSPYSLALVALGTAALGLVARPPRVEAQEEAGGSSQVVSYTPGS